MKNKIRKLQEKIILWFPFTLFFSYHPVIRIFSGESFNLELSLPIFFLGGVVLSGGFFLKEIESIFLKNRLAKITAIPILFSILSLLWTENIKRGSLTIILVISIYLAGLVCYEFIKNLEEEKRKKIFSKIEKNIILAAILAAGFAWLQSVLDVLGVGREYTMLCRGCTYLSFGFPHPNGWAIEPQFFGNLLLFPILILVIKKDLPISNKKIWLLFLMATLFFTFSRGAIYSFGLAILILSGYYSRYKKYGQILKLFSLVFASFCVSTLFQGIMAAYSPIKQGDLWKTTTVVIHHLSLGKIDFREKNKLTINEKILEQTEDKKEIKKNPSFDGYVKESTNIRLGLSNLAIKTWAKGLKSQLLGVGIGGAGRAMYQYDNNLGSEKEVVQNQFISLLLELGLLGCIMIAVAVIIIIIGAKGNILFLISLIAFLVSLNFFAGLANALHIYVFLFLAFIFEDKKIVGNIIKKHNEKIHKKKNNRVASNRKTNTQKSR